MYRLYRFINGEASKVEEGKDKVSADDMRNLKNTINSSYKSMHKADKLDIVSLEAYFVDENIDFADADVDVELIVETADEYDALHKAIGQLQPKQQELIHKIYFENMSIRQVARDEGVTEGAIRDRLNKIYKRLRKML